METLHFISNGEDSYPLLIAIHSQKGINKYKTVNLSRVFTTHNDPINRPVVLSRPLGSENSIPKIRLGQTKYFAIKDDRSAI